MTEATPERRECGARPHPQGVLGLLHMSLGGPGLADVVLPRASPPQGMASGGEGTSDLGAGPSHLPFTFVLALDGDCWWCETQPEVSHAPLSIVVQRRRTAGPSLRVVPEGKYCQQRADHPPP